MPKRRGRRFGAGRGLKRPSRDLLGTGSGVAMPGAASGGSESDGELGEEELEGLEEEDMKMISRMGL